MTVSANKAGRAYVKPFHAQAHSPLPGNAASEWLRTAAELWVFYLRTRQPVSRKAGHDDRLHVRSWQDAAGKSRWVASVMFVHGRWWWTRIQTPPQAWEQLLERQDNQIGRSKSCWASC